MHCVVDFSEELSRLKLSDHPSSLFVSSGEASCHIAVMPAECKILNSDSSRKHSRSSSSGFSQAEMVLAATRQTLSTNGMKSESSGCEEQSSYSVVNQLFDSVPSQSTSQHKSGEISIPSVKSWAAVLTSGKNSQQQTPASAVRGSQIDQPKQSKSLPGKNTSVNRTLECKFATQSRTNRSTSRSATRDSERRQFVSSDVCRDGAKANDSMSSKRCENRSSAWITVSPHDKKTKSRSQTPRQRGDASGHSAGSHTAAETKQDEYTEVTGVFDAAAASNFQSKPTKQKKKKKKLKGREIAVETTSDVVERRVEILTHHPAPEFHDLNEFPSLSSLNSESGSKKTPLQMSSVHSTSSVAQFTSGIYLMCYCYYCYLYLMCYFIYFLISSA